MAAHIEYAAYKQDNRQFLYWIIHASNSIISTLPVPQDGSPSSPPLNTSGQTTVAELVGMAELVGKHMKPIPSRILHLLESIIAARLAYHEQFQQLTAASPDAEIEKSNATHRFFIEALQNIFHILGGHDWVSRRQAATGKSPEGVKDAETPEEVFLANKFSPLNLETTADGDASSEASDQEADPSIEPAVIQRRKQRKPGKGKKGRKGKKHKRTHRKPASAKRADLEDVPLDDYRIIDDEASSSIEYLAVAYSAVREWSCMRNYLQTVWREVAYQGFNGAVAGVLSNMAVCMVKEAGTKIFVDFPGHDAFDTIIQTITRGNIDLAQDVFSKFMFRVGPTDGSSRFQQPGIDLREFALTHAYEDLIAFVEDYQKTRSGRPTKAMQAKIDKWDPELNLQKASREKRLKWRQSYTINWLYDLINLASCVVMRHIHETGERHVLEDINWSRPGPWGFHRAIFGVNEFATFVTSLAMQKPGTDVSKKILPHHVFQLQCIVDAFTVSRGWTFDTLGRQAVEAPPKDFRPRRHINRFLSSGFLESVTNLGRLLEKDGSPDGTVARNEPGYDLIKEAGAIFINWLGRSRCLHVWDSIPPSRFIQSDSNGLWEFSPFLCGVGLADALELAFRMSMVLWERMIEPTLLVHLHNMLTKRGYITKPIGPYNYLQVFLADGFFVDAKAPQADFSSALLKRLVQQSRASRGRRGLARDGAKDGLDIHAFMNVSANHSFKKKSNLVAYHDAGWDLNRIPECDIKLRSGLAIIRIMKIKPVADPVTGKMRLADADLIRRVMASHPGMKDEDIIAMTTAYWREQHEVERQRVQMSRASSKKKPASGPGSYRDLSNAKSGNGPQKIYLGRQGSETLLAGLKGDVFNDVCGFDTPLSGINYVAVTAICLTVFTQLEAKLESLRNPVYRCAYECVREGTPTMAKRVKLVSLVMAEENEECLRVMAEVLEANKAGPSEYLYWNDIRPASDFPCKGKGRCEDPKNAECTLM